MTSVIDRPLTPERIRMRVTEQWMRTLGASCPQGADDFFQMGGDSMRMIELLLAVSADFSISTGFDAFYSSPDSRYAGEDRHGRARLSQSALIGASSEWMRSIRHSAHDRI